MEKSESIKELATALAKAQYEMVQPKKNGEAPITKSQNYSYVRLDEVVSAIKEPFKNNGLSYSQFMTGESGGERMETIIMHDSGEWISSSCPVLIAPKEKNVWKNGQAAGKEVMPLTPQDIGGAITYYRRYCLMAAVGMVGDEDDDASSVTNTIKERSSYQQKQPLSRPAPQKKVATVVNPITQEQLSKLQEKIDYLIEQEKLDAAKFLVWVNTKCGVPAIESMTNEHYEMAIAALAKKEG